MKKLIPLFLILIAFSGCTSKTYTPVITADFNLNAVYKTGDFSYSCKIVKTGDVVSMIPTSTSAAGMLIRCDGKTVTFKRGTMQKDFDRGMIDKTNPAVILYEVFTSMDHSEDLNVEKADGCFEYKGNTGAGKFILKQGEDSHYQTLSIPAADISIEFQN